MLTSNFNMYRYFLLICAVNATFRRSLIAQKAETVCKATDELRPAICFESSHPEVYTYSKSLVRIKVILDDFAQYCTGWLVGCEGHVMTNAHCFTRETNVGLSEFEFMAEGTTCSDECSTKGACSQTRVITNATLVVRDEALDFALLKLPHGEQLVKAFGYLKLQPFAPMVGQAIYIPQHPQGFGKRIAMTDERGKPYRITSTNSDHLVHQLRRDSCAFGDVVGYQADTHSGSFGSPVIDLATHCVVALHFCGQCQGTTGLNAGIPMNLIAHKLLQMGKLPKCALQRNVMSPTSEDLDKVFGGSNLDTIRISGKRAESSNSRPRATVDLLQVVVLAITIVSLVK